MTEGYDSSFRKIFFTIVSISGISALLYPLLWMRYFHTLFGNNLNSNIIILTSYFLGTIVGSYIGGHYVEIKRKELRLLMYLEIGTALLGLVILISFLILDDVYRIIFRFLIQQNPALLPIVNFFLLFIIFFPISSFMGAKFSVLGRYLIRSENIIAREIGTTNASYMLGAAIGSILLVIFILSFGIYLSCIIVTFFNIIVAFVLRILLFKSSHPENILAEFYDQHLKYFSDSELVFSPVMVKIILIGGGISSFILTSYVLLIFQNIFYFSYSHLLVNSLFLTLFFLSFAAGNYLSIKFVHENRSLLFKFLFFQVLVGVFIFISVIYLPKLIIFNQVIWQQGGQKVGYYSFIDIIILTILPLLLTGVLFPITFKIYVTKFEQIGKRVGSFYSIFFSGIVLGFLLTKYVLIQYAGITRSIITLAALNFTLVITIVLKSRRISLKHKLITSVPLIVIALSFYLFFPDFYSLNIKKENKVIAQEGIYSVVQNGSSNLLIKVNGKVLAGTSQYFEISKRMLAHIPLLLAKNPQKIFINGFGTGEIPYIVSKYNPSQIDCAEQSPEILNLADLFVSNNRQILKSSVFSLKKTLGATYLHLTEKKYDVIINNYNFADLNDDYFSYTREFFKDCRRVLSSDGILAMNISLADLSFEKFKTILSTFQQAFNNISLWYNDNDINFNMMLVGSPGKNFHIDFKQVYERIGNDEIKMDLAKAGLNTIYEILDCYICGPNSLTQFASQGYVQRFNHPFFIKSNKEVSFDLTFYLQLFKKLKEPVAYSLINVEMPDEEEDFTSPILNMYFKSSKYILDGLSYEYNNSLRDALQAYRFAYQINRLDFSAKRFIDSYYDPQLIKEPKTPTDFTENAKIYYQKMEYHKAIEELKKALEIDRRYAPAYFGLGINYEILNNLKMAKRMYLKTIRLKPKLKQARERLDSLYKREKELEESFKRGLFNK